LSLLIDVTGLLRRADIPHAVIGAAALAVHGVARATADLDLFALDPACLEQSLWSQLRSESAAVEIRHGDTLDPLAGVVRFESSDGDRVDLVVGRHAWQRELLDRALRTELRGAPVPVVRAADLVLLKLFAGGSQDAWDIDQLLDLDEGAAIVERVEAALPDLPDECAALWRRILEQREAST